MEVKIIKNTDSNIKSKLGRFFTIKRLVWIYILSILVLVVGLIQLNDLNKDYISELLKSNSATQLSLMNAQLDNNLQSAQVSIAMMVEDQTLIDFLYQGQDSRNTAYIRQEGEIKAAMKRTLNYIGLFGCIDVYMPQNSNLITTRSSNDADTARMLKEYERITRPGWYYFKGVGLYYITLYPVRSSRQESTYTFLVAGEVQKSYLYDFTQSFNMDDQSVTYMNLWENQLITPVNIDPDVQNFVANHADNKQSFQSLSLVTKNKNYQIQIEYNSRTDGFLVSYFDYRSIYLNYRPITYFFIGILIVLLLFAIVISVLFYLRVYKNLTILTYYFSLSGKRDLSIRIQDVSSSEFSFVYEKFNEMMNRMEDLVKQITEETKLREKAELKQLQSQINPHFLYNSLFFIISMANHSPEAVISMTENLAEYYRYLTKKDVQHVTVDDELSLIEHYLKIMSYRKELDYLIDVPDKIRKQSFVSLILQPIVENAIYHGIESRQSAHVVKVVGEMIDNGFMLSVEDDGNGMTITQIAELKEKLVSMEPETQGSVGLWNVHQRLLNLYGKESGLKFAQKAQGLRVYFWIPFDKEEG